MLEGAHESTKIRYYSDITSKRVDWLRYPYIAYGK